MGGGRQIADSIDTADARLYRADGSERRAAGIQCWLLTRMESQAVTQPPPY